MELTEDIKNYIDKSVLCWLATVSFEIIPNVSPKEIFNYYGTDEIIIANIASPQTVQNIKQNENVCLASLIFLSKKDIRLKGKQKLLKRMTQNF